MFSKVSKTVQVRARLSFLELFAAKAYGNGAPKFSAAIVVEDKAQQKNVATAVKEVAAEAFGDDAASILKNKKPIHTNPEDKGYPEGSIFFNAKTGNRPGIVSRWIDPQTGKAAIITEDMATLPGGPHEMYPGVVADVLISVYSYKHPEGGRGIAFGLEGLQRYDEGERFGRNPVALADVFDAETPDEADLTDVLGDEEESEETADPLAGLL